jgi:DNA-binding NtrC family response regulator
MEDSDRPLAEETEMQPVSLAAVRTRTFPRLDWEDSEGRHEHVLESRALLGSSPDVDIVIRDPMVSRLHAEIELKDDGVWVRDIGSKNGTFVDGLQVQRARVPHGFHIRVGSTTLNVDYDAAARKPIVAWPDSRFHGLIGNTLVMRELFATLARVAPMDASVLIHGETGTGKELVARAIHLASARAHHPFVTVDCGALPENLLDAELFGHTKGAFTGAVSARAGAIETAEGGTVFLDEIGEVPISMQPKLLRLLESRTIRRVGETIHRNINVRFVTATHRDLLTMVSNGEFREDLYFRLSVLPIVIPPLRDRREDIELLVNHFLGAEPGSHVTPELMRELLARPWRGNVRELRNFVERARALGASEALAMTNHRQGAQNPFGAVPSTGQYSTLGTGQYSATSSGGYPAQPPPSSATGQYRAPAPSYANPDGPMTPSGPGLGANLPNAGIPGISETLAPPPSEVTNPSAQIPRAPSSGFPGGPSRRVSDEIFLKPYKDFREQWVDHGEREYVRRLLERHQKSVSDAAKEAGVDRTYIYRLIRKHNL